MWSSQKSGRHGCARAMVLVVAVIAAGCGSGGADNGSSQLEIRTLGNRADLISGGDALVEVVVPAGVQAAGLKVDVDGRDVSSAFASRADGKLTGLVTGLANGANVISASAGGARTAQLTVTNAPRSGPVYSGAQILPYVCATPVPVGAAGSGATATPAINASGLAGAPDAQCNIAAEFKL